MPRDLAGERRDREGVADGGPGFAQFPGVKWDVKRKRMEALRLR